MQRNQGTIQTEQSAPFGSVFVLITCPEAAVIFWHLEQGRREGALFTAFSSSYFISVCLYIVVSSQWLPQGLGEGENISENTTAFR